MKPLYAIVAVALTFGFAGEARAQGITVTQFGSAFAGNFIVDGTTTLANGQATNLTMQVCDSQGNIYSWQPNAWTPPPGSGNFSFNRSGLPAGYAMYCIRFDFKAWNPMTQQFTLYSVYQWGSVEVL